MENNEISDVDPLDSKYKNINSFSSWFFNPNHEPIEKLLSFSVLILEIILLLTHSAGEMSILLMLALNFIFILYFIYDMNNHYKLEFFLKNMSNLKQFKSHELYNHQYLKLQIRANEAIKQFRKFGGFLICTGFLYVILILENVERQLYNYIGKDNFVVLQNLIEYSFSILIHIFSYASITYLLKCFYVMYYPTITGEDEPNDALKKVNYFWFVIGGLLLAEIFFSFPLMPNAFLANFYFEFVCSLICALIMILLFARFESRLLGINPFTTLILYIYAVIQTTLPLITNNIYHLFPYPVQNIHKVENPDIHHISFFVTLILSLCLLGKIMLYNVFVYLYKTKRLFYYFVITKINYDKENVYWNQFNENSQLD